jgi:hypothetical protein
MSTNFNLALLTADKTDANKVPEKPLEPEDKLAVSKLPHYREMTNKRAKNGYGEEVAANNPTTNLFPRSAPRVILAQPVDDNGKPVPHHVLLERLQQQEQEQQVHSLQQSSPVLQAQGEFLQAEVDLPNLHVAAQQEQPEAEPEAEHRNAFELARPNNNKRKAQDVLGCDDDDEEGESHQEKMDRLLLETPIFAHCMRCKAQNRMMLAVLTVAKKGRLNVSGTCANCDGRLSRYAPSCISQAYRGQKI